MKKLIIFLAIFSFTSAFTEQSDVYTCFSCHKIETPEGQPEIEHSWKAVEIPVIFDYTYRQILICAGDTLRLKIGPKETSVGPHYETKEGDNGLDLQATDNIGRKVTCIYVILKNKSGSHTHSLLVRYCNVILEYKLTKL